MEQMAGDNEVREKRMADRLEPPVKNAVNGAVAGLRNCMGE